jgi:hypothetical protein
VTVVPSETLRTCVHPVGTVTVAVGGELTTHTYTRSPAAVTLCSVGVAVVVPLPTAAVVPG